MAGLDDAAGKLRAGVPGGGLLRGSAFEFRFRVWIITALYVVGFVAPWRWLSNRTGGPRLWSWLALQLYGTGWMTSRGAFVAVLAAAIGMAFLGAALRVWGTATVGSLTMEAGDRRAAEVVAAGPYRFVRNPLYIGIWLTSVAVSLLMPWSGAIFFVAALAVFLLRLIGGEEAFLLARHGEAYLAYRARVGRLLPRLRPGPSSQTRRPRWFEGLRAEVYPVGVAVCLAGLGWTYDAELLTRAVIICFGASLVARAMVPGRES